MSSPTGSGPGFVFSGGSLRRLVPYFFVASGVVLPGDVALVGVSSLCLDAGCLGNMAMPQGLKVCPTKAIYNIYIYVIMYTVCIYIYSNKSSNNM